MNPTDLITAEDTLTPIRPGKIGERPFWNSYARQFIYAPAFEFSPVPDASGYRFHVRDRFGTDHAFSAGSPDAPLSPVWAELPVGPVFVEVDALDPRGRKIASAGDRTFYRNAPFNGCYPPKACSYSECAAKAYEYLFRIGFVQQLAEGKVDPDYPLSCYPSKMLSAVINGMINYAAMSPEKHDAAMRIAVGAAEHLIETSIPAGQPLEYLPLTYDGKVIMAAGGKETVMMLYPAGVGRAMLNLYSATDDRKYLDCAIRIGDQYLRLQQPNGSWHLILNISDGQPKEQNYCCPASIMLFLEALSDTAGRNEYRDAAAKGIPFFRNMIESFNWEGQFEDVEAQQIPYQNLTKHNATDIYMYLGKIRPDDPEVRRGAREIQRFAEDQFIVWEQPGWTGSPELYKARPLDSMHSKAWGWDRWHTPCVYEQFRCYLPVDSSSAKMIRYFLFLYDLEKNPLDLAKARALGDAITRIQCPDGRIPTWMNPDRPIERDWINCMFASANALNQLARYDSQEI